MRLTQSICLAISLLVSCCLWGQNVQENNGLGSIRGKVIAHDSLPLELVPVFIVGTNKATLTDNNGQYNIGNILPGKYTLRIQILGGKQKDTIVNIEKNEEILIDYRLPVENITALQEVRVVGNINKFSRKESFYVARMPLKHIENPQVFNSVPKELITEQMAVDLGSIAKNVPGAGVPMIANQGRVTFRSRGFETEPNARNGVAGAAFSFLDPVNLERVEAIKGPSTTLFGTSVSSSYGGLYNRVTKKPFNGRGGEASYTGGSWNYNRLTFDYNTPLNEDKTVLFRLNGATTFEKSFQDNGFTNSVAIAPSLSYQVNDRMSVLLDVEFAQAKGTSVVRFNPNTRSDKTQSIVDMQFPYKRTFLGDDLAYSTQMLNVFGQINYKISSSWTSQTVFSRARSTINGYITALNGRTDSTLQSSVIVGNTNFIATDLQQNFIGDFKIGNFRNRAVIGLDYYNNYNSFDRVTVNGPTVNFINTPKSYKVTRFAIDSLTPYGSQRKEKNGDNTYAAYVSDVFNITDRLLVMGSVRVDNYHYQGIDSAAKGKTTGAYTQTAFSHKSGIVYELVKNQLSLFGNYMNGFFNVSGTDEAGNKFKPQHANQLEYGIKLDTWNHKLVGTISYYNIKVSNVLRIDPNNANFNIQDGTQYSKGLEMDITANPISGLNIIAGYAYNDSKFTQSDSSVLGLRPALSGPKNMFNFWASYRIQDGPLSGLGIGFGGNVGSMSYQTNTRTAKIIIPAYQTFDATIFYDQPKFRIGFKIDNLTSEKMWSVRLMPQPPARFLGSIALKF